MKLDQFTCTVRLGGNLLHEVNKENITTTELKVLRKIHGGDAVVNVKRTATVEVDEMEEYFRLARIYTKTVVEKALNITLDDYDTWLEMQHEQEQRERDEAARRRQESYNEDQRQRTIAAMSKVVAEGAAGRQAAQQQPAAAEA